MFNGLIKVSLLSAALMSFPCIAIQGGPSFTSKFMVNAHVTANILMRDLSEQVVKPVVNILLKPAAQVVMRLAVKPAAGAIAVGLSNVRQNCGGGLLEMKKVVSKKAISLKDSVAYMVELQSAMSRVSR